MKLFEFFQNFGFCKRALARDKRRHPVDEDSPKACSFCLMGAIIRTQGADTIGYTSLVQEVQSACHSEFGVDYVSANDHKIRSKQHLLRFLEEYNL